MHEELWITPPLCCARLDSNDTLLLIGVYFLFCIKVLGRFATDKKFKKYIDKMKNSEYNKNNI